MESIDWSILLKEAAIAGFVGTIFLILMYGALKYFLIGIGQYFKKTDKSRFKSLN